MCKGVIVSGASRSFTKLVPNMVLLFLTEAAVTFFVKAFETSNS